eukprot:1108543-Pelagomonas_calceolata.AAC.5
MWQAACLCRVDTMLLAYAEWTPQVGILLLDFPPLGQDTIRRLSSTWACLRGSETTAENPCEKKRKCGKSGNRSLSPTLAASFVPGGRNRNFPTIQSSCVADT